MNRRASRYEVPRHSAWNEKEHNQQEAHCARWVAIDQQNRRMHYSMHMPNMNTALELDGRAYGVAAYGGSFFGGFWMALVARCKKF